ncbi:MAG: methyltransferase domain-containing protein [Chitinophagaceae bacterium]|nr:methyltransferase domain-containing protein [Chitinophagaceae bacterium]
MGIDCFFAGMQLQTQIQTFHFGNYKFDAFIPDADALQLWYHQQLKTNEHAPAPYWAQVWAAAYALCNFLAKRNELISNKTVLELAAGLGLPSFLAAQTASAVLCSDVSADAVELMQKSIAANQLQNCSAQVLDWNKLPDDLTAEVILLSDINYEPQVFATLHKVLVSFLEKGATIILSTPQRLIAKPFIEQLQTFVIEHISETVTAVEPHTDCSVFVLKIT